MFRAKFSKINIEYHLKNHINPVICIFTDTIHHILVRLPLKVTY